MNIMNHARLVLFQNAFEEMATRLAKSNETDEAKEFLAPIRLWLEQSKTLEQGMQTETMLTLLVQEGSNLAEKIAKCFQ